MSDEEARGCAGTSGTSAEGGGTGSARPGPEQGPGPIRPPLRRDRHSRMIAGVCGGLGRHLDVDPVVFRILFAVLTFIGGFGLLAYAAAWLFVPDDGEDESELHRLLTGRSALGAVAVAVLVVLGFMVALTMLVRGLGHAIPLLVLAAAIIMVLIWRGDARHTGPGGTTQYAAPGPRPWWQRPVPTYPAPGTDVTGPATGTAGETPADAPSPLSGDGDPGAQAPHMAAFGTSTAGTSTAGTSPRFPAGVAAPAPQRRLSGLTLSGALLVLGLIAVVAETGAIHIDTISGLAVAVMAVGAGMMVGGLFGRARALIPLGLVLTVPLILANAIGVPLRGETGHTFWTPASTAALRSPYNLAAGHGELDLSAIDPQGGTVHVKAYVGVGQLTITVPDDVTVDITTHVGMGHMIFPDGSAHSGIDVTHGFHAAALSGAHGTIVLDLRAGVGDVEVDRAG